MVYACERSRRMDASADVVWQWMSDVRRLLRLNVFHVAVDYPAPVRQAGIRVPIVHSIGGLYRQVRVAYIRAYRPYFVAWGELRPYGRDRFPHSQSFTVVPVDAGHCLVQNHLRGTWDLPGAGFWFLPLYGRLAPRLLDLENRRIAAAVATGDAYRAPGGYGPRVDEYGKEKRSWRDAWKAKSLW